MGAVLFFISTRVLSSFCTKRNSVLSDSSRTSIRMVDRNWRQTIRGLKKRPTLDRFFSIRKHIGLLRRVSIELFVEVFRGFLL